ncbi:MAG TPA: hypothetical protein VF062_22155 [Candidatus Limnocylindrales bacterium]
MRFHTLPGSKRYPDSESEYEIILGRHNEVLTELAISRTLLVVTSGYSERPQPQEPARPLETLDVHPEASYWTSACLNDEPGFESWIHLYASQITWSAGCLDPLLRRVVDEAIANVLLADVELRWLYHPYDGGMDILLPSPTDRDALRNRHRNWLSTHPSGL